MSQSLKMRNRPGGGGSVGAIETSKADNLSLHHPADFVNTPELIALTHLVRTVADAVSKASLRAQMRILGVEEVGR